MPDKEPTRELEELSFSKYIIRKRCSCQDATFVECSVCGGSGSIKPDEDARYFVMRVDGDHDSHARNALHYYALKVWVKNKKLSEQITDWLKKTAKPFKLF